MAIKNHDGLISAETLLDDIRAIAVETEGTLTEREYASRGTFGVSTLRRRFGSWNAAKEAAGLETIQRVELSDDELLTDLQQVAQQLDGPVTEQIYAEYGRHGPTTYRRHFGSWTAAKRAAGLIPTTEQTPAEEDVLQDIMNVAQAVDTDYVTPDQYATHGTYSLEELPETADFWDRVWDTIGVPIMPLYTEFRPGSE